MDAAPDAVPDDIAALKEALAVARAKASEDAALIAEQKLRIARLERQVYGQRSERSSRLIDQLALTFEELEASATEDELAAEQAVARTTVRGFTRQRPERNTFPDHLPRERVVIDPQAWLSDVLSRIAAHPAPRLDELLPWNWTRESPPVSAQAA
jgi:transposase